MVIAHELKIDAHRLRYVDIIASVLKRTAWMMISLAVEDAYYLCC